VDETGSKSYTMAGFDMRSVTPRGPATTMLGKCNLRA
jgi:hypothetical protein